MWGGEATGKKDEWGGNPHGHPTHCYKGRSLLFNKGDIEGKTRLEMTGLMSSIPMAKLLSFYSNLCRTYKISPQNETQKNPIIISALSTCRLVLYLSSAVLNSFWNQIFEEKRLRG
jgi:hypothetical protein